MSTDLEEEYKYQHIHFTKNLASFLLQLPSVFKLRFKAPARNRLYSYFNTTLGFEDIQYNPNRDEFHSTQIRKPFETDPNAVRDSAFCGRLFDKGEPTFRCRDCFISPSISMCSLCFDSGDHEFHDVSVIPHTSRDNFCSCCDPELCLNFSICQHHSQLKEIKISEITKKVNIDNRKAIGWFFEVVLDLVIQVVEASNETIPDQLDVFSIKNDASRFHSIFNHEFRLPKESEYGLIIFDDDFHTIQEFERICQNAIKCSPEEAKQYRIELETVGRTVISYSYNIEELLKRGNYFGIASFQYTIRSSLIIFLEELCIAIIHYIFLMTKCRDFVQSQDGYLCKYWMYSFASKLLSRRTSRFLPQNYLTPIKNKINDESLESNGTHTNTVGESTFQNLDKYDTVSMTEKNYLQDDESSDLSEELEEEPEGEEDEYSTEDNYDSEYFEDVFSETFSEAPNEYERTFYYNETISIEQPSKYIGKLPDISLDDEWPFYKESGVPFDEGHKSRYPKRPFTLDKCRLDFLLTLDFILTKRMRKELRQLYLYSPLISDKKMRAIAGTHFFINFPKYLLSTVMKKPHPAQGILGLTVHLVSRPGISYQLVEKMNFIPYIIALIERCFVMPSLDINDPSERYSSVEVNYAHFSSPLSSHTPMKTIINTEYKTKLFTLFLQHLHFLVEQKSVQELLAKNHLNLASFLYFLTLFQGMNPSCRVADRHVEYENELYQPAFEVSFYSYRIMRPFAMAYSGDVLLLAKAIRRTIYKIDYWIHRGGEKSNGDAIGGDYCVEFEICSDIITSGFKCVKFCVEDGSEVSFHYILHWFLSLLLHHVSLLDQSSLETIGFQNVKHLLCGVTQSNENYENALLNIQAIFDFPLRAIVHSAQIRVNLWVRNGQSIRAQGYSYREMTDALIYLDLFLVQYFLILVPINVAIYTIIDRFSISKILTYDLEHEYYDCDQFRDMVLEFYSTLLYLLTERHRMIEYPPENEMIREIIHNTMKPIPYSELERQLPDRLIELCNVKDLLNRYCQFKEPEGQTDSGTYTLKEEYCDLVNPYYFINSRNSRDYAEQWKKRASKEPNGCYKLTLPLIENSPFANFGMILDDDSIASLVFMTLYHTFYNLKCQPLVDDVLEIFIIAAEDPNSSLNFINQKSDSSQTNIWVHVDSLIFTTNHPITNEENTLTILDMLFKVINSPEFELSLPKLWYVLSLIEKYSGQIAASKVKQFRSQFEAGQKKEQDDKTNEQKKSEAKARLAKIRMQFQAAQNTFMKTQKELYDDVNLIEGEIDFEDPMNENSHPANKPYITGSCLICTEPGTSSEPYGMLAYVQPSKLLSILSFDELDLVSTAKLKDKGLALYKTRYFTTRPQYAIPSEEQSVAQHPPCTDGTQFGFHLSSCGHLLHMKCMDEYYKQLEARNTSFPSRSYVENLGLREVICPLCKSLVNVLLPVKGNIGLAHQLATNPMQTQDEFDLKFWNAANELNNYISSERERFEKFKNFDVPIISPYNNKPIFYDNDSKIQSPFRGDLQAGINEPLAVNGSGLAFTALRDRSRRTSVVSPSRTSAMINEFMEHLNQMMKNNNGDPLNNNQYKEFFNPKSAAHISKSFAFNPNPDIIGGFAKVLDIFRVCYGQRSKLPSFMISWREYFSSDSLLDPILNGFMYTITFSEITDRSTESNNLSFDSNFVLDRIPTITRQLLVMTWNIIIGILYISGEACEFEFIKRSTNHIMQLYGERGPSVLLCDPFHLLVEFALIVSPLFKMDIRYFVKLLFYVTLVKLIVGLLYAGASPRQNEEVQGSFFNDIEDHERAEFFDVVNEMPNSLYNLIEFIAQDSLNFQSTRFKQIWENKGLKWSYPLIYRCLIIYVRKAIIFLDACQVPIKPYDLYDNLEEDIPNELDQLLYSLGLGNFDSLIKEAIYSNGLKKIISEWCISYGRVQKSYDIIIEYPYQYQLYSLPKKLFSLFTTVRKVKCISCRKTPTNPAVCLACGTTICLQADCCRGPDGEGEANIHRISCGGTSSIFLAVQTGAIVMLHNDNGSYFVPPYCDIHGESDIEYRRGFELFLNKKRYDHYLKLYLNHLIPQTIARKLESQNGDLGGWPAL